MNKTDPCEIALFTCVHVSLQGLATLCETTADVTQCPVNFLQVVLKSAFQAVCLVQMLNHLNARSGKPHAR
eukprot:4534133-Pyramimonas_sp.AAC.3